MPFALTARRVSDDLAPCGEVAVIPTGLRRGTWVRGGRGVQVPRLSLVLFGLLIAIMGSFTPAAAVPPGDVTQLSRAPGGTGLADADGGLVVWAEAEADGQTVVKLHDARAGTTRTIATDPMDDPTVADGLVFWRARVDDGIDLFLFDVSRGVTQNLSRDQGTDLASRSEGGRVVWSSIEGETGRLWLYDHRTEVFALLAEGHWMELGLRTEATVDGDHVAYRFGNEAEAEIFVYNIAARETQRITDNGYADLDPVLDGELVAWRGYPLDGAENEVFVRDLATETTTQLTQNEFEEYGLVVGGGSVGWVQRDRFGSDVFVWAGRANRTSRVTFNPYTEINLSLEGEWMAWEMGSGSLQNEILLHHRPSGITRRITDDYAAADTSPQLSGGRLVWTQTRNRIAQVYMTFFDSTVAPALDPLPFPDIATAPSSEAVQALAQARVVEGFGDGTFRPNASLNRAQFAKMLAIALHLPVQEGMTSPFRDLGANDATTLYPNDYVGAAYAARLVQGVSTTSFAPWKPITRAQLVTMLMRGADERHLPVGGYPPASFRSALGDFDPIHGTYMARAEYHGILAGIPDYGSSWDPWKPTTRGEMAVMLWYLMLR